MVAARHVNDLHYFYPLHMRNWWSDDWLLHLYGRSRVRFIEEITFKNGAAGTRYAVDSGLDREELWSHVRWSRLWVCLAQNMRRASEEKTLNGYLEGSGKSISTRIRRRGASTTKRGGPVSLEICQFGAAECSADHREETLITCQEASKAAQRLWPVAVAAAGLPTHVPPPRDAPEVPTFLARDEIMRLLPAHLQDWLQQQVSGP
jgi:hypothetical protein